MPGNTDGNERICAEQRAQQEEVDLRAITDAIRHSIVVPAPDGTTLYANRAALELTGLTVGEVNDKGFFARAFHPDDLDRVREERLQNENLVLREEDRTSMFEEIVGSSKRVRQVLNQVEKAAPSDSTVLVLSETGTGKELISRALHRRSKRAAWAFVRVNCAAIPQSRIASELFGHEKGAFTGALQRRVGRFEAAGRRDSLPG